MITSLLLAAALTASPKTFNLQFPMNSGVEVRLSALAKSMGAALVSPIGAPEWVEGAEAIDEDAEPIEGERLAKVRFKVLDSYPQKSAQELTCYVPVDVPKRLREGGDMPDLAKLPEGRYLLAFSDKHDGTSLVILPSMAFDGQFTDIMDEPDAVCGCMLVPTDSEKLAAGQELPAVLLRSLVAGVKSRSAADAGAAMEALQSILAPVGHDAQTGKEPPQIEGASAADLYTKELIPSVLATANAAKPARKAALLGFLGHWGVTGNGEAALDALLEVGEGGNWNEVSAFSEMALCLDYGPVSWGKWLMALEEAPAGAVRGMMFRAFEPSTPPEKEWPRLFKMLDSAPGAKAYVLNLLRGWAGKPAELEGLSTDKEIEYWGKRLGAQ